MELFSKALFRCDCGNSQTPFACQLNNDKDYNNDLNVYNDSFFDVYCHCK
jgi:E3 ubiquitin-protein ligase UBR7